MKRTVAVVAVLFLMVLTACTGTDVQFPDGDAPDGDTSDGDQSDGDLPDGDLPDGDLPDGDKIDGDVIDGDDEIDGDMIDGDDEVDGDMIDGDDEVDGDVIDGDAEIDGDVIDGDDEVDGDVVDGDDEIDGDVIDGDDEIDGDAIDGDAEIDGDVIDGDDEIDGDVIDGDDEVDGDVIDGDDEIDGDVVDGDAEIDGDVIDGDDAIDGDAEIDGDVIDGDAEVDGDVIDGDDEIDGDLIDGDDEIDGDAEIDGDVIDGDDEIDGDVIDGDDEIDGDLIDGDDEIDGDVIDGDEVPVEICDNGVDDDDDDLADCADPDCHGAVSEPGACTNDPDLGIIADTDMLTVLQGCVLGQSCAGDAQCNSACVSAQTGLSGDCSDCFGGAAACLVNYCFMNCLDPQSAACADCLAANCLPDFEDCFGSFYCPWEYSCVDGLDNDNDGLIDDDDPECQEPDGDVVDGDVIDGDMIDGDDEIDGDEACPECDDFSGMYCQEPSEGPYCDLLPIVSIFVAEVTPCEFEGTATLGDGSSITIVSDGCGFTDLPVEQAGCTATHDLQTGQLIVDCPSICTYITSQDACTVDGDVIDGDVIDGDVIDGDDEVDGDVIDGDDEIDGEVAEELACGNGIDDDGNDLTDCEDPSCFDAVAYPGACTNPEDRAIEVTIDDPSVLFQACLIEQGCGSNVTCNTECVATQTGLSNDCSGCYGNLMTCTWNNCLYACLDPSAPGCLQCVEENCFFDFNLCHGLFYCTQELACDDQYDNDSDSLTDCADPDCSEDPACQSY